MSLQHWKPLSPGPCGQQHTLEAAGQRCGRGLVMPGTTTEGKPAGLCGRLVCSLDLTGLPSKLAQARATRLVLLSVCLFVYPFIHSFIR